jgi:hypothetical protein
MRIWGRKILAGKLIELRDAALTPKDVKNEDWSGDVYENKMKATKCTPMNPAFYTEMHRFHKN